jgi:hypothetical protein
VFEQHRKEWSHSHPGKYVTIQGDVIVEEFFSTYAEAFKAGPGGLEFVEVSS